MTWTELFIVLAISHLVGDYLLQTEWQARNKAGGLGSDPLARRALLAHVATYTLAFVPALIWLADVEGGGIALLAALAIALPHLVIDDRRLIERYAVTVKGCSDPPPSSVIAPLDQSLHLICLWIVAVLVV